MKRFLKSNLKLDLIQKQSVFFFSFFYWIRSILLLLLTSIFSSDCFRFFKQIILYTTNASFKFAPNFRRGLVSRRGYVEPKKSIYNKRISKLQTTDTLSLLLLFDIAANHRCRRPSPVKLRRSVSPFPHSRCLLNSSMQCNASLCPSLTV